MSDASRHARFLAERLAPMGIEVALAPDAPSGVGTLRLGPQPFAALDGALRIQSARFYTLGFNRLKFFHPRALFDLPAIDVSRCETASAIERALRKAFADVQRDLAAARDWLAAIGAEQKIAGHGTRLRMRLAGESGLPWCEVRSPRELLLSSTGVLADASLGDPGERRFRPLPSLDSATELETAVLAAANQRGRLYARRPRLLAGEEIDAGKRERCALVVSHDNGLITGINTHLALHGVQVEEYRDAERALAAFHQRSFELIVVEAQLPRADGLELTARFRQLPGVEQLPIVLVDERESQVRRAAARDAGATVYVPKPVDWPSTAETLVDLLENVGDRRYERYPVRLPVHTASADGEWEELTEQISRGGLCLRSEREIRVGESERYTVSLPGQLGAIKVVGDVVTRVPLPGRASVLAGIRIRRFEDAGEPRWIRVIEVLAQRAEGR